MTSEEFDDWVPDGLQAEWVEGKGIIFVSTGTWHGVFVGFWFELLRRFCRLFDIGEVFAGPVELRILDGRQRREPDVFVVLNRDRDRILPTWVDSRASFVVEFVSASNSRNDEIDKLAAYQEARIEEYLMIFVDQEREPLLHRLDENGRYQVVAPDDHGRLRSRALPGFWFETAWMKHGNLPDIDDALLAIAPDAYAAHLLAKIQRAAVGHVRSLEE